MGRTRSVRRAVLVALAITVAIGAFLAALVLGGGSRAAQGSYRSWQIEARVTAGGDIATRQVIDMQLRERENGDDNTVPWRQAYRQYVLESWQVTGLSGISVTNLDTGEEYTRIDPVCSDPQSFSEAEWNRQCAGHWYIADVSHGASYPRAYEPLDVTAGRVDGRSTTVEVGWNFPSVTSTDSMRFEIEMTFDNAVTAYRDVDQFQWSIVNDDNEVPVGRLDVSLELPEGKGDGNSWAWLHTTAQSSNRRSDDGHVLEFTVQDLRAGQYCDMVVMTTPLAGSSVIRHVDEDRKDAVYEAEEREQREWNEQRHREAVTKVLLWAGGTLLGVGLAATALVIAIRRRRDATYRGPIVYWREPPAMSPAAAARVCARVAPERGTQWDTNAMTATVLSLMSKGAIGIYPGHAARYRGIDMSRPDMTALAQMIDLQDAHGDPGGAHTSTIVILPVVFTPDLARLGLCASEQAALDMLVKASQRIGSPVFDLDQMDSSLTDDETAYKDRRAFTRAAERECDALGAFRSAGIAPVLGVVAAVVGVLLGAAFALDTSAGLALILCVAVPVIFAGTLAALLAPGVTLRTPDSPAVGQVLGLKRYLEDYSDFTDRGVLDLALWDRYMVYAAAFGISDKALAQLIRAYPQAVDSAWVDSTAGHSALMYWTLRPTGAHVARAGGLGAVDVTAMSANFGSLGAQLSTSFSSISSTITAAMPSSSGSSGGGFSGGGFGGGGGGGGGSSGGFR